MAGVQFRQAIEFLRDRLALPEDIWEALLREADAAARSRARSMSLSMHRDILQAVLEAIEEGTTLETFRERFDAIARTHGWTGEPETIPWRTALIFRTQVAQAQAAGRWRQIQANKERFPLLRYLTVGDHRVRPAHRAWHNVVLPADHPWWRTHFPPNGFNCRCRVVQLRERDLERYSLSITDPPPAMNWVDKIIRQDGDYHTVRVPGGIDAGFAVNFGEVGLRLPNAVQ